MRPDSLIIRKRDLLALEPEVRSIHGIYSQDWDTLPLNQKEEITTAIALFLAIQFVENFPVIRWYEEDALRIGISFK